MIMLGSKEGGQSQGGESSYSQAPASQNQTPEMSPGIVATSAPISDEEIRIEDIPF